MLDSAILGENTHCGTRFLLHERITVPIFIAPFMRSDDDELRKCFPDCLNVFKNVSILKLEADTQLYPFIPGERGSSICSRMIVDTLGAKLTEAAKLYLDPRR